MVRLGTHSRKLVSAIYEVLSNNDIDSKITGVRHGRWEISVAEKDAKIATMIHDAFIEGYLM